jgi:hypothetical protein
MLIKGWHFAEVHETVVVSVRKQNSYEEGCARHVFRKLCAAQSLVTTGHRSLRIIQYLNRKLFPNETTLNVQSNTTVFYLVTTRFGLRTCPPSLG